MIAPFIKTTPTASFMFRCDGCGQIDLYATGSAIPFHCNRSMGLVKKLWFGGDKGDVHLSSIVLDEKVTPLGFFVSDRSWPSNWKPAFELWQLRHGRVKGERIGWYGKIEALEAWEFVMTAGVVPAEGRGLTKDSIISQMWSAINAG